MAETTRSRRSESGFPETNLATWALNNEKQDVSQIHMALFQTQLSFILCHEYAHHVHGHLAHTSFGLEDGDIQTQVFEVDADCYSIYFVLTFLMKGEGRTGALERSNCADSNSGAQDEALIASFVFGNRRLPVCNASGSAEHSPDIPATLPASCRQNELDYAQRNRLVRPKQTAP